MKFGVKSYLRFDLNNLLHVFCDMFVKMAVAALW